MLNINFLGKSTFEYDGKILGDQLGNKASALICLLVLNNKRYLSREKIIGYLWPDSNQEAAKYNLRYNLWLIKKYIGEDAGGNLFLKIDNDCCSINRNFQFSCDIIDIMKFKPDEKDTIESILRLKKMFRGDLLEGCYFNKCDELNNLIIYERINFEQRKVRILKRLAELYENDRLYEECTEAINEILEAEPYDEEMVLKLLDIYARSGKRTAAIAYYNNFCNRLGCSLGIPPSSELRNKYNEIRLSLSDDRESESAAAPSPERMKNSDRIRIVSRCLKGVDYFWISDVVGKIADIADEKTINSLTRKELLDLCHIQGNILKFTGNKVDHESEHKREVLGVCIINAFVKLLENFCRGKNVTVVVLNQKNMDEVSSHVLEYLKSTHIQGLDFIEQ
ncbi:MAG: BTAD domain-containing putative transcriptional regulator [Sedimentibacter sp.]|uniref:AfsR/SARP family transcriptional regulator n=1 Tax=Sedimentibacter sp. TaxID=1960295 RepID=UPI0031593F23